MHHHSSLLPPPVRLCPSLSTSMRLPVCLPVPLSVRLCPPGCTSARANLSVRLPDHPIRPPYDSLSFCLSPPLSLSVCLCLYLCRSLFESRFNRIRYKSTSGGDSVVKDMQCRLFFDLCSSCSSYGNCPALFSLVQPTARRFIRTLLGPGVVWVRATAVGGSWVRSTSTLESGD